MTATKKAQRSSAGVTAKVGLKVMRVASWAHLLHSVCTYLLRSLVVPAQLRGEYGQHLNLLGAGLCVLSGLHRLKPQKSAELAQQQQYGGGVLRVLLGGFIARTDQTCSQQLPKGAVHQ